MKVQGKMFLGFAAFILATAVVYGFWSKEAAGTTALFMAFALCTMIGFYLAFTARRADTGAQDREDADVADDAGELGFFSPHSWQPLALGVGGSLAFLGIIFGWWLLFFSLPVILVGVYGWVFEYYRGESRTQ
ncbi:Cytochrome c oxidase subunit IV [Actinacidiphila yanglinensis]|uniref:Cytochrome c oxidase polypeptide 4 n=1 Tax=Actinacidiphila yanglinensis TaxID=310779 RepID=A0A1H5TDG9_9ACTN|nr:cytochrome c oxidase subunit 4 [Actinacidiphila yanglinensis]SEF60813.1 Cytochrome c oxidase subunit IV [Actinacidiphila yanglinensis]